MRSTPVYAGVEAGRQAPADVRLAAQAEALVAGDAWVNLPNAISAARALSGPGVAWLILEGHNGAALGALALAGASDWADGYVAKRWGQASVVGSYLDPAADKVLIGCTVAALAWQGALPAWLAALILGRDALLVGGAFVHRYRALGWRARGWSEFFRITSARAFSVPPAPFVRPLLVSKANTVLQLGLVAGCVARSWYGWPPEQALWALGAATGVTTVASCAAYVRAYLNGTLLK
ncbi:hypothetical protein WJX81_000056 [Elliptochloris bilobata]|uniref:Cardiolipin synthase n=1 Tax=Elliptochloris bilobata TaxID=381761 RepID=A0AAW1RPM4_9CHLO